MTLALVTGAAVLLFAGRARLRRRRTRTDAVHAAREDRTAWYGRTPGRIRPRHYR